MKKKTPANKVYILANKCCRCKHTWIPRVKNKSKVCPKCKSPYWDKPRKNKNNNKR